MYAKPGYEKIAIDLISIRKDQAGKDILKYLSKSEDASVRKSAESALEILAVETDQKVSTSGDIRAKLTFTNETNLKLNINWIDYKGNEAFNKFGVIDPEDSWFAGEVQSGNIYRVRIDDPKCEYLKCVRVTELIVVEAQIQTLKITPEMITAEMRQQSASRVGC